MTLASSVEHEDGSFELDEKRFLALLERLLGALDLRYPVDVLFVEPSRILELNSQFRGIDSPTDVLSFPMLSFEQVPTVGGEHLLSGKVGGFFPCHLGDIVICPAIAKKQAMALGQGLDREVLFLLIHGLLHLCGYDHEKPEDEVLMLKEQNRLLDVVKGERVHGVGWGDFIRERSPLLGTQVKREVAVTYGC